MRKLTANHVVAVLTLCILALPVIIVAAVPAMAFAITERRYLTCIILLLFSVASTGIVAFIDFYHRDQFGHGLTSFMETLLTGKLKKHIEEALRRRKS